MQTDKENKKLVVEKPTRQSALKEYFQSTCFSRVCRTSKQDRYYAKARDKLSAETDLAEILRAMRLFKLVFVQQFSEESRKVMKETVEKISVRSSCDLEKIAPKLALNKKQVEPQQSNKNEQVQMIFSQDGDEDSAHQIAANNSSESQVKF